MKQVDVVNIARVVPVRAGVDVPDRLPGGRPRGGLHRLVPHLVGVLGDRAEEGAGAHCVLLGLAGVEADDQEVLVRAAGAVQRGRVTGGGDDPVDDVLGRIFKCSKFKKCRGFAFFKPSSDKKGNEIYRT